jgi:hypothetical protein
VLLHPRKMLYFSVFLCNTRWSFLCSLTMLVNGPSHTKKQIIMCLRLLSDKVGLIMEFMVARLSIFILLIIV